MAVMCFLYLLLTAMLLLLLLVALRNWGVAGRMKLAVVVAVSVKSGRKPRCLLFVEGERERGRKDQSPHIWLIVCLGKQ